MKKADIASKALEYASQKHRGEQYGNWNFIYHPIQVHDVMETLLPDDENLLAACYLHDVMENTDVGYSDLEDEFNEDVADLVREVTKSKYNTFPDLHSVRGVILKLIDRACNLSHMEKWNDAKKLKYIQKSKFWKTR